MSDEFGDMDQTPEEFEAEIVQRLPALLRSRSCPAGEPWTGDHPEKDHGHTDCWFHHLAADEIDLLRRQLLASDVLYHWAMKHWLAGDDPLTLEPPA